MPTPLPWQDDSVRIPSGNFFQYQQGIVARRAKLDEAVAEFTQLPGRGLTTHETKKGCLTTQHPTASGIGDHYKVNVTFLLFPNGLTSASTSTARGAGTDQDPNCSGTDRGLGSANQNLIDRLRARTAGIRANDPRRSSATTRSLPIVKRRIWWNVSTSRATCASLYSGRFPNCSAGCPSRHAAQQPLTSANKVVFAVRELLTAFKKETRTHVRPRR